MTCHLASFAVADDQTLGRVHAEKTTHQSECGPFEQDWRRVTGCAAFRRLQYKTQVFVNPQGDHYRTRLTHTLEVASLARMLAVRIGVNSLLSETIALAHDLGHPPFGHAGEQALNTLLRDYGGFEHNVQSLRVVDYLEHPFPPFRGLNLTDEVRESLIKHRTRYDRPVDPASCDERLRRLLDEGPQPTIEGQIVSIADRLAYDCHDLEDAMGAGIITLDDLKQIDLTARLIADTRSSFPDSSAFAIWRTIAEGLHRLLLNDAVSWTQDRIRNSGVRTPNDVRHREESLVGFSEQMSESVSNLEAFLLERVYRHPKVKTIDDMAGRVISELFRHYTDHPDQMPERFSSRVVEQGVNRVVCDYVSGMTDRFCRSEYERIFLPFAHRS